MLCCFSTPTFGSNCCHLPCTTLWAAFHYACGCVLLWWLSQYHDTVNAIPHPKVWWFFTFQALPVYCILSRGVLVLVRMDIVSSLMVLRRRVEPAPFFCHAPAALPSTRRVSDLGTTTHDCCASFFGSVRCAKCLWLYVVIGFFIAGVSLKERCSKTVADLLQKLALLYHLPCCDCCLPGMGSGCYSGSIGSTFA
jgi:hypothetical protein